MKQLHFQKSGARMLVATEGPYRFVLRQVDKISAWTPCKGWKAEIYEREGRRTPKHDGNFATKSQAIDWLAKYRVPETEETI